LKLVYAKNTEKAAAYREALKAKAAQYGIDPAAIDGMQRPILVRALDESPTPEAMALKSRQYNQNLTQAMQAEAEGISRARFLKPATLDALATGIKEKGTIREFLASAESAEFAKNLLDDGVIQQSEYSSLITKTGRLNEKGKALALTVLRGFILPDYDLIQALPKKVIDKLDAVIPAFAQSKLRGEGWDLSRALDAAMRFVAKAESEKTTVEQQFRQHSLSGADAMRDDPQVQALAMTIANADAREIRARLEYYMSMSDMKGAGQNSLLPTLTIKQEDAFQKAFWEKISILDGETLRDFNPKENARDAALQWAMDNAVSGKTKTIEDVLKFIEKRLAKKNIDDAERDLLFGHAMELGQLSGKFSIEKPKLGKLWEDPDAPRPEPTAKPEEAGQPGKDATGKD
ncbi:MAG: hypothetical protein K2H64_05510, partial [Desulfovibrio sp.]|nr:hypothetical protein [Desulfovibrio sp.]